MSPTEQLATNIRPSALEIVHRAKASHIASALSISDIVPVLYGEIMRFDPADESCPGLDEPHLNYIEDNLEEFLESTSDD